MEKEDIELEIQERVTFKMNELLTAMDNSAKLNWGMAFQNNSPKHSHYWEAFEQMKKMLVKEKEMVVPYEDMAEKKRRMRLGIAVDKIMERFCKRGDRDWYQKERFLVNVIEKCQK